MTEHRDTRNMVGRRGEDGHMERKGERKRSRMNMANTQLQII